MNAYWRAANYLSVGQIYLKDNPLLERPPTLETLAAVVLLRTMAPDLKIRVVNDDLPEIRDWRWPVS
jgi:phosphoketolase